MKKKHFGLFLIFLTAMVLLAGCDSSEKPDENAPYIKSITLSAPADKVVQGKSLQFSVEVDAGNGAGEGIVWSISSSGHSGGTTISTLGFLRVDLEETAAAITVRAASTDKDFSGKYGEKTVAVEDAPSFNITYGPFSGGNVTGPSSAKNGTTVTMNITNDDGKVLQSLIVTRDGGGTERIGGSGKNRTFTMPAVDVTVSASFFELGPYFSKNFDTSICSFYDKFEGNALDRNKWDYQNGNGYNGWGNQERQYYRSQNVTVSGGILRIEAKRENYSSFPYTSGKLVTATGNTVDGASSGGNHFSQTYGRFEAKIRMTKAEQGMWPAFWMMPVSSSYGGWPRSGEIDIMEMRGRFPSESSGTIHMSSLYGNHYRGADQTYENGSDFTDWHVYGVLWTQTGITHLIDGKKFRETPFADLPTQNNPIYETSSNGTPFDKDFFMILNLAVGGTFDGGRVPSDTAMPIALEVEWVRAYTLANDPWEIAGTVPGDNYSN